MASAKKCDVCGKYYDKNSYGMIKPEYISARNGNVLMMVRAYAQEGDLLGSYDLCDVCAEKFDRFINGCEKAEEFKCDHHIYLNHCLNAGDVGEFITADGECSIYKED